MAYMLLIQEPVGQRAQRTEAEGRALYAAMMAFGAELQAQGRLRAAESLASQQGAARVTVHQGQARVVDGPFAEAKEMIGGFFLLQNVNREEALALAARCPAAAWATVEVRALAPCYDGSAA